MSTTIININTKFSEWLNQPEGFALRSERLQYELGGLWTDPDEYMQKITAWMQAAYAQGCRDMAQDTLDTLGDYACAVSGLDAEMIKPEEVYDRAQQNLMTYYTKILDESDI